MTETERDSAPDPQRVGRYQIIEEIGDGAMGRVWRGFDPELSRTVAIKTVKSEYLTRDTREEYLHRFRREARAAGQLSHPNIVRIFDVGDDYFVMELVEGVTLADLLKHRGRLEVPEATALLAPLAEAIDDAHRSGVIHRDIKPANIMVVQSDGRPKLMDFGVARVETSAATAAGQFFGSPSYMAPEQISQGDVTARADLFSFAVVAYETLTGQRPFQGASITNVMYRVVHDPAPPPRQLAPELPPHFDHVFERALAKDPALRFPNATTFLAALRGEDMDSLLAPLLADVPARPPGNDPRIASAETHDLPGRPTLKRSRRWRAHLPWVALFAGALGVVGWKVATRPTEMAQDTSLQVEVDPMGADVWLDGRRESSAPVLFETVRRGTHRIRLTREGYAPAELTFQVDDHMGVVPLRFSLTPMTAPLDVRTEPGVTVSIDGQVLGVTPIPQVRVSPGMHQLLLEREGYVSQVHARQARPGEPLVLEAQLAPAPPEAAPSRPVRIAPSAAPEPEPVDMGEVMTPPRRVSGEAARYPEAAQRLRLEGSVLVDVLVEPNGTVGAVRVLESAGSILDQAVSEAVRTWRFEPARVEGQPVRVRWQFRHTFRNK